MNNIFIIMLALCVTGCGKPNTSPTMDKQSASASASIDNPSGGLYLKDLAAAIDNADRVVLTEHSIAYDVLDAQTQPQLPVGYMPVTYVSRELTPRERADFAAVIRLVPPATQDAFTACIFEPHHSITFYRGGKQTSEMKICLQCGEIEWAGSHNTQPWALVPTLNKILEQAGMRKDRDWWALAKAKGASK
jgi:hypothetical protein